MVVVGVVVGVVVAVAVAVVVGEIAMTPAEREVVQVTDLTTAELREWGMDWLACEQYIEDDPPYEGDPGFEEFWATFGNGDAVAERGWWDLRDELLDAYAERRRHRGGEPPFPGADCQTCGDSGFVPVILPGFEDAEEHPERDCPDCQPPAEEAR